MYKLLGRQTSGNVQKVLFMLEELGAAYTREDYGRQFENTQTAEYKALNPTSKVPTLVDGDTVIWESNTILRYLAASGGEHLNGATPAEKTEVERWMDSCWLPSTPGYLAAFKGAKLTPEEQTAEYKEQVKDLVAQLKIIDRPPGRQGFPGARQADPCRYRLRADPEALRRLQDRPAVDAQSGALGGRDRRSPGLQGGNRCGAGKGRMMIKARRPHRTGYDGSGHRRAAFAWRARCHGV